MALTKAEMAEHLFEKLGINKRDAKDIVEFFLKKYAKR
jgi:integration host factor subunit alpha